MSQVSQWLNNTHIGACRPIHGFSHPAEQSDWLWMLLFLAQACLSANSLLLHAWLLNVWIFHFCHYAFFYFDLYNRRVESKGGPWECIAVLYCYYLCQHSSKEYNIGLPIYSGLQWLQYLYIFSYKVIKRLVYAFAEASNLLIFLIIMFNSGIYGTFQILFVALNLCL